MKNKSIIKKIIMGKFKGKTLKLPSMETTRSSKSIVMESFFNTIQFEIIDAHFVEVFSGSGSIGLEALSRGASNIFFMERDREALKVLKQNISQTDPSACQIFAGDSFSNIDEVVKRLKKKKEDAYFYIDPPFSIREGMEDIYEKMIKLIASLPGEVVKLIVIEHMTGLEIPSSIGPFTVSKSKKFGNTSLTYLNLTI
ncbi:MAG: 16S rRNA (guanine966-N2)-methyltransferase [Sulfurimonas sp.]|jgi:16S rRNA (guanine966-N2)-methyltransferase|uniref:16S rRNA (guanine(966)-N(2))-methyltransferase RsmD n=1 Tax=Sulfurimonas sp. TaxID=2022749 RepID=UPI0039E675CF